ncbi:hypothetical protein AB0G74_30630 [Streptomyces sp. NPDC020875]|uniref:hypothetical protein n=1 Tax=Streptomyces sp. NPDC020875 TaxID=3154898 RepID=UPI0033C6B1A1
MRPRRPLGRGPARSAYDTGLETGVVGPAQPRVHATNADLDHQPLYRPEIELDDLRARGVLGGGPASVPAGSRTVRPLRVDPDAPEPGEDDDDGGQ